MAHGFCPSCGAALDPQLTRADGGRPRARCGWVVHDTPRPCAGALVIYKGRLLLVRRTTELFLGWWDIPGGFLDPGEHAEVGVARDVEEETGLIIEPVDLVGIYPGTYGSDQTPTVNLVCRGRVLGGFGSAPRVMPPSFAGSISMNCRMKSPSTGRGMPFAH